MMTGMALLRLRSSRTPYNRAGIAWSTDRDIEMTIGALAGDQLLELSADPAVTLQVLTPTGYVPLPAIETGWTSDDFLRAIGAIVAADADHLAAIVDPQGAVDAAAAEAKQSAWLAERGTLLGEIDDLKTRLEEVSAELEHARGQIVTLEVHSTGPVPGPGAVARIDLPGGSRADPVIDQGGAILSPTDHTLAAAPTLVSDTAIDQGGPALAANEGDVLRAPGILSRDTAQPAVLSARTGDLEAAGVSGVPGAAAPAGQSADRALFDPGHDPAGAASLSTGEAEVLAQAGTTAAFPLVAAEKPGSEPVPPPVVDPKPRRSRRS